MTQPILFVSLMTLRKNLETSKGGSNLIQAVATRGNSGCPISNSNCFNTTLENECKYIWNYSRIAYSQKIHVINNCFNSKYLTRIDIANQCKFKVFKVNKYKVHNITRTLTIYKRTTNVQQTLSTGPCKFLWSIHNIFLFQNCFLKLINMDPSFNSCGYCEECTRKGCGICLECNDPKLNLRCLRNKCHYYITRPEHIIYSRIWADSVFERRRYCARIKGKRTKPKKYISLIDLTKEDESIKVNTKKIAKNLFLIFTPLIATANLKRLNDTKKVLQKYAKKHNLIIISFFYSL